jgi:hypothetical protein
LAPDFQLSKFENNAWGYSATHCSLLSSILTTDCEVRNKDGISLGQKLEIASNVEQLSMLKMKVRAESSDDGSE